MSTIRKITSHDKPETIERTAALNEEHLRRALGIALRRDHPLASQDWSRLLMLFAVLVVPSLVSCFVGFGLEVVQQNIRHVQNGPCTISWLSPRTEIPSTDRSRSVCADRFAAVNGDGDEVEH